MIKIGICDDEKSTCTELEELLYEYGKEFGIELEVYVWHQGESLCKDLINNVLEILFLDIELLSTDGIKVGRYIRDVLDNPSLMIIYISSKSRYAMNLFKIQPFDFLIKPLVHEEVKETIKKAIKQLERKKQSFECTSKGCRHKVLCKDIMYFYSRDKKVILVTTQGTIEFNEKLKNVIGKLPHNFLQIHQSFLVNLDYVTECSYEEVGLQDGTRLTISQPYRKTVRETLMKNRWG